MQAVQCLKTIVSKINININNYVMQAVQCLKTTVSKINININNYVMQTVIKLLSKQ